MVGSLVRGVVGWGCCAQLALKLSANRAVISGYGRVHRVGVGCFETRRHGGHEEEAAAATSLSRIAIGAEMRAIFGKIFRPLEICCVMPGGDGVRRGEVFLARQNTGTRSLRWNQNQDPL